MAHFHCGERSGGAFQGAIERGPATERGIWHLVDCVAAMKEVLADKVGLALDCGPGWMLPDAIRLARLLEPYHLLWLEDLLSGDYTPWVNAGVYRELTRASTTPIYTGEQIYLRQNFKELIEGQAVHVPLGRDMDRTGNTDMLAIAARLVPPGEEGIGPRMKRNFLVVDPEDGAETLRGLASPVRVKMLKLLHTSGPLNVNEISAALSLPQSTVSSNVQILEEGGLIRCETIKAKKGNQKVCHSTFDEIVVMFKEDLKATGNHAIEVAMPLGLYTSCNAAAPCGLCSTEKIIGLLDVPDFFLDPDRMKAALLWFGRGYVEYQFPNNAKLANATIERLEFSMELSSEVPGTSAEWPSDITLWVNFVEVATWTSPGDYGDKRGVYTPHWWKLKGSQYGKLKTWTIGPDGAFIDGVRVSDVTIDDLDVANHHSIRMRVGIRDDAKHPGGVNIFGRGFGNYDQDIVMRLYTSP